MSYRLLLALSAVLVTGGGWAQPVLEQSGIGDVSLNNHYVAWSENGLINGENVTWEFTVANEVPFGSAVFMEAAGTPYADQFPTCDRALYSITNGIPEHAYFSSSDSTYELVASGLGNPPQYQQIYIDPMMLLRFPLHYGDSFSDTFQQEGELQVTTGSTYSGYGTLVTPLGTFTNVVKLTLSPLSYEFWNVSPLYQILSATWDMLGRLSIPAGPVGVGEEPNDAQLVLFPNPAQSHLTISNRAGWTAFTVVDPLGRVVIPRRSISGHLSQEVVVSTLTPGPYLVMCEGPHGSQVVRFVKE